jgi:hypothetical protein
MRIGILANGDPANIRTWSGVPYFMTEQLKKRFSETVYLPSVAHKLNSLSHLLNRVSRKLLNRQMPPEHTRAAMRVRSNVNW